MNFNSFQKKRILNRKYKFGARYTKGPSCCRLHTNWHFEAHKKEKSWDVISTNAEQWAHMKGTVAPSVLLEAKKWTHESDITVDSITQGSRVNLLWGKKSHQFRPGHSLEFVINYIWAQNQESNNIQSSKISCMRISPTKDRFRLLSTLDIKGIWNVCKYIPLNGCIKNRKSEWQR